MTTICISNDLEFLTEAPVNWTELLARETPDNAVAMLKFDFGPHVITIMETLIRSLESRRFLAVRRHVIQLVEVFSTYSAEQCLRSALSLKAHVLLLESIDEFTIASLIHGTTILINNLALLLTYIQDILEIYDKPCDQVALKERIHSIKLRIKCFTEEQQSLSFSPNSWLDACIF